MSQQEAPGTAGNARELLMVWRRSGSTAVTDVVIHQHFQVSRALQSQEPVAGTLQENKGMERGSVTPVRLMQQPDQWPKIDPGIHTGIPVSKINVTKKLIIKK